MVQKVLTWLGFERRKISTDKLEYISEVIDLDEGILEYLIYEMDKAVESLIQKETDKRITIYDGDIVDEMEDYLSENRELFMLDEIAAAYVDYMKDMERLNKKKGA